MKIRRFLVGTGLFLMLVVAIYYVHVRFFPVNVLFYSSVFDAALAVGITVSVLFGMGYFAIFNWFEKLQMAVIWLLLGYVLAISVPTVIDRSLSFYILEKIAQRGGGIEMSSFEDIFTKEFTKEHRVAEIRLTEQRESGTIVIEGGCVKLTERGRRAAAFSRFFRKHLLPKHRLLMGNYTDELIDPFRNSQGPVGYECK